ncbi:hypothetical protein [Demequina pelophila]|uniref:hypothetical protein n=1 Tax=Demequina pelophila TaxID=1638984 RepID=UPI000780FEDE|nr:hypothetical protein [Demequina pelophila]
MSTWQAIAVGIIPSIGVGAIFWFAIRAVVRADRNERAAVAREEAGFSGEAGADARPGDIGPSPDDAVAGNDAAAGSGDSRPNS